MTTKALIIPAAGSGSRLNKETAKPFLLLSGRTILEHTIRKFLPLKGLQQIVVATSEEYLDEAQRILGNFAPESISVDSVLGGDERQHSIYKALQSVSDVDLVIVHDAVRPFVKTQHIEACCKAAAEIGGALLGVPVKDTIKRVGDHQLIQQTPSRRQLWQAQTPQVFKKSLLVEAYEKAREDQFVGTDDSSLVERLGNEVKIVEGDRSNFKITYPLDLELAQLLIDKEKK